MSTTRRICAVCNVEDAKLWAWLLSNPVGPEDTSGMVHLKVNFGGTPGTGAWPRVKQDAK